MDKLGERIYKYRTARGLSQLELSELLEVSRQSISKWETDVAVPELSKLVKMAELFEISLDMLILGKEDTAKEEKEEKIAENPDPQQAQKIEKLPETSRLKTGFGWFFLGTGTLISFLILLFSADLLSTLFVFIPFGLCAFFCLKQFRRAALWCTESWYVCIMVYFHYATGTYWVPHIATLIHAGEVGINLSTIMSFVFFFMLVFFICLTLFSFRKEKFELSKKKHIFWAICAALALPLRSLIMSLYALYISNLEPKYLVSVTYHNFRILIYGLHFITDLAFTILFTIALLPTLYWIRTAIAKRKIQK